MGNGKKEDLKESFQKVLDYGYQKACDGISGFKSALRPAGKYLSKESFQKVLDYGYERACDGIPGFKSASQLAENYLSKDENPQSAADSLIKWQIAKAGTSGFLTGIGGVIMMPVTIPANIASVLYVQVRMIAAIACLGGYDINDDQVKTLVYICMAGNSAKDIAKDVGIVVGTKLTTQMIKGISGKTITAINQKVGFRLFTKFGQTGAINLGKAIPAVGGVIGGTFDVVSTKAIGEIAKEAFLAPCNPPALISTEANV